jgi:hypothetical protein
MTRVRLYASTLSAISPATFGSEQTHLAIATLAFAQYFLAIEVAAWQQVGAVRASSATMCRSRAEAAFRLRARRPFCKSFNSKPLPTGLRAGRHLRNVALAPFFASALRRGS